MNRKLKWLTVILVLGLLVIIPRTSMADEKEKDDGFMTWLSTWNPLREYGTKPLQENIPNFEIRGFIQNLNSIGTVKNENRDKHHPNLSDTDRLWQRIEWLFALEPRYKPTPNLQMVAKLRLLYNAAYDWSEGYADSYAGSESELDLYRRASEIIREGYVDYINGPVQVRLGKQQVAWGRVDGRQILDFIHGMDYRRFAAGISSNPFLPIEEMRVPKWMTNIQYFPGDFQFQFLWIPDFEPSWPAWSPYINQLPWQFNQRYPPTAGFRPNVITAPTKEPPRNLESSEIGFMAKILKDGWDISIHYLWAWTDKPVGFYRISDVDFTGLIPLLPVELFPEHKRIHKFGFGADKTWSILGRQWAAKLEARYLRSNYYMVVNPGVVNPNGTFTPINWTPGNRGFNKADSLLTGLQIETYVLTNMTLILRWDHEQIFKYSERLGLLPTGGDPTRLYRHQDGIFFTIIDPVRATYDRLVWRSSVAYLDDGQWRWEPNITYELTEDINLMVGGHFFWGNADQIFGQFRRSDGIDFGVKWSF